MGTWGPGIFSDDTASDVKAGFGNFLGETQGAEKATEAIVRNYGAKFEDPGDDTAFWLGLALTQWKIGRLDQRVRTAALKIIDDGLDLGKWDGSPDRRKRARVLAKTRATLEAPQPAVKPLPRYALTHQFAEWQTNEVVAYRARDRHFVMFHQLGFRTNRTLKVRAPVVSILNWFAQELPNEEQISGLTYIEWGMPGTWHIFSISQPRRQPIAPERIVRTGCILPSQKGEISESGGFGLPEDLDRFLETTLTPWWRDPGTPSKRPREYTDWAIGELILYRTDAGNYAAMRVTGHHQGRTGLIPIVELMDWYGSAVPEPGTLESLTPVALIHPTAGSGQFGIYGPAPADYPADRIVRPGIIVTASAMDPKAVALCWRRGMIPESVEAIVMQRMRGKGLP
jgi:hypothetical protein